MARPRKNMAESASNEKETNTMELKVTKTVTNNNLEDLSLVKTVQFTPVESEEQAKEVFGDKFLEIFNLGAREYALASARDSKESWNVVDDEGVVTDQVWDGQEVNSLKLNKLIEVFAIGHGFSASASKEAKKAAKVAAREDIRTNPEYLKILAQ